MVECNIDFGEIEKIVKLIGEKYFIDPCVEKVGNKEVECWNILMGVFSYIGKKNTLLVGEPGTGKTTFSGVISAILSGLPFDLYDSLKIQGHPEQTKDTMLGRLDLGKLSKEGVEDVIWQPQLYLPALIFDELNRLPPKGQSIILEYIRTGSVEHLGKYFSRGKFPFFATINYDDVGTYPLSPPFLDRFDISLEFIPDPSCSEDAQTASCNIEEELKDPEITKEVVTYLLIKDMPIENKIKSLQEKAKEHTKKKNLLYLELPDKVEIDIPWSPDAKTFLRCIWGEINLTYLYGYNRSSDPRDTSSHNKPFASSKVKGAITQRRRNAITYYTSMLAVYLGDKQVEIDHVLAVAPYVLAHRLEFTDDYKAKFAQERRLRGERREQDLTRRVLDEIKKNFDDVAYDIQLLDAFLAENLDKKRMPEIKKILGGPPPDHPLLLKYYNEAKERWKYEVMRYGHVY